MVIGKFMTSMQLHALFMDERSQVLVFDAKTGDTHKIKLVQHDEASDNVILYCADQTIEEEWKRGRS